MGTERDLDVEDAAPPLSACMTAALGDEERPRLADLALWTSIVRLKDCGGDACLIGLIKGTGVVDWS